MYVLRNNYTGLKIKIAKIDGLDTCAKIFILIDTCAKILFKNNPLYAIFICSVCVHECHMSLLHRDTFVYALISDS